MDLELENESQQDDRMPQTANLSSKEVIDDGPSPSSAVTSKTRKFSSTVWTDYEIIVDKEGVKRAKCIHCKTKSYAIGSSSHGTTNLKRHIEKCAVKNATGADQMHLDYEMKIRKRKLDQNIYREKMAIAIMKHNYPFKMVEHEGISDVHQYLNEDVKLYSRNTARADCMKIYKREKAKLKEILAKVPSRICLTSDLWTSCTTEGYICLTSHYVDENWTLHSKILNFSHFPPPHRGDFIAEKLMNILKEWGIEKKIFSLTLDNASNNDSMKENLRSQLCVQNNLLCKGRFFHVRCCAHILNLIVQDGLKVGHEAIYKIRESVKYIKGSEIRMQNFKRTTEEVGETISMDLRLDVSTRWNSTFLMLESVLKYRKVFSHLRYCDPFYSYCPTLEEWERAERMCKFLKPFAEITTLFSGSDYPTSNLYFLNVWKIQIRLLEEMENSDDVINSMARRMKPKFDKYWDSYSVILAMGTILDPRFKLAFIDYCYTRIDESSSKAKLDTIVKEMRSLFEEYVAKYSKQTTEISRMESGSSTRDDDIDEFDYYECELNIAKKSEIDLYLEEPKFDRRQHIDLDILQFWKNNQNRYPVLSLMARDIMSIPITTVASESSFSIGSRVLTKYRSSLRPDTAQTIICARNWLYGYETKDLYEDEVTNEELVVELVKNNDNNPNEASNTS